MGPPFFVDHPHPVAEHQVDCLPTYPPPTHLPPPTHHRPTYYRLPPLALPLCRSEHASSGGRLDHPPPGHSAPRRPRFSTGQGRGAGSDPATRKITPRNVDL